MIKSCIDRAKEYLMQIELYDAQIKNKCDEIENLRSMATSVTATLRPDGGSPSGGVSDKVGNTVSKIVDMQNEINKDIDRFIDYKREVMRLIDQIASPDEIRLLHLRYFQYKPWEEIAVVMNYTYRNVCYIHSRALQSVSKLLEDKDSE